jgi:flavin-dependent dehydrogenase
MFDKDVLSWSETNSPILKLDDGAQVAVIGGGPAGSFFTYFLLELSHRVGVKVDVDIYEPKDFKKFGPIGCNHCGGIISESLVQHLATEGINIPTKVVQRGIDAYVMHTDVGSVRIETPLQETRIAAMYRGTGPLGSTDTRWASFDGFLQELTQNSGAQLIHEWVKTIEFDAAERPVISTRRGRTKTYDLIVGAVGVNSALLKQISKLEFGYRPPKITKTSICEFFLGYEMVQRYFGDAMHVFLLNIPRLRFAALIPKGNFVTLVLLGDKLDNTFLEKFLEIPEVKRCFPPDLDLSKQYPCQCFPYINVHSAVQPYADRVVLVGDCATSKLYKNGIGAAYITAKAAATTAIFAGVSAEAFKHHYWPICQSINTDNSIGKLVFSITSIIQKSQYLKRGMLRVVQKESQKDGAQRYMSSVLWDTFTGSAAYKDIFLRTLKPRFITPFFQETAVGILPNRKDEGIEEPQMSAKTALGKVYQDGDTIVNQGEPGDCMYVIQSGQVEVIRYEGDREIVLAQLGEGDFFGEMALFEREVRSTTVRALGEVRVLTVDSRTLMGRIQEDSSIAFRIIEKLCSRIRQLDTRVLPPESE